MRTEVDSVPLLPAQYPDEDTLSISQDWNTEPQIQEYSESLLADEDNEETEDSTLLDLPTSKRKRFTSVSMVVRVIVRQTLIYLAGSPTSRMA